MRGYIVSSHLRVNADNYDRCRIGVHFIDEYSIYLPTISMLLTSLTAQRRCRHYAFQR